LCHPQFRLPRIAQRLYKRIRKESFFIELLSYLRTWRRDHPRTGRGKVRHADPDLGANDSDRHGRDAIGIAQTGTGKTAAFALPILHRLVANPRPPARKCSRILVLSPTRELSGQILDSFRAYGRPSGKTVSWSL
jgi:hypothetical protein